MATVTKSKEGFYDAEYNFESEDVGETEPTGWTNDDGANTASEIIQEYNGHSKPLAQRDYSGANDASVYHSFGASKTDGIVEVWGTVNGQNASHAYILKSSTPNTVCYVYLTGSGGTYIVGKSGAVQLASGYNYGQWVHIAMCFNHSGGVKDVGDGENLDNNKFRVYIDGVKIDDYALDNNEDADDFYITTNTSPP